MWGIFQIVRNHEDFDGNFEGTTLIKITLFIKSQWMLSNVVHTEKYYTKQLHLLAPNVM